MSKEYDPRMHTAEHVLNRTMDRFFGCGRCISSHLNPGKSKCDYRFARPLLDDEAEEVEKAVNAVLASHLPVAARVMPRREAEGKAPLGKLPASIQPEDPIRVVFVGDYDVCPCIGAHAANTEDVGRFHLLSHDYKPGDLDGKGVLRLRFKLEP